LSPISGTTAETSAQIASAYSPADKVTGQLLGPADDRRPEKAAEIAERIDPGNAGSSGGAG
jgi:hypothetical protein